MADSPENNRRPLPRVNSNETRELQKRAQATEKKVQGNINDIRTFGQKVEKTEQEINDNKIQLTNLSKRVDQVEKKEKENSASAANAEKKAEENSNTINQTAAQQQENTSKISGFESQILSTRDQIAKATASINERLAATSAGINISIQSIAQSTVANRQTIGNNSIQLNNLTSSVQVLKADFTDSLSQIQTSQAINGANLSGAVKAIEDLQKNDLLRSQRKEEQLSLANQKKRNQEAESELEASRQALGKGMAGAVNAVNQIGGMNIIDKLKAALATLAGGLIIANWKTVWSGIQALGNRWEKITGYFVSNILKGILEFTISAFRVGKKIVSWIGKKFIQAGNMIKGVTGWFITQGKRGMRVLKNAAEFLLDKITPLLQRGAKGVRGVIGGIGRGIGNAWNATGGKVVNWAGNKAKAAKEWMGGLVDSGKGLLQSAGDGFKNMATGAWNGIKNVGGQIVDGAGNLVNKGVDGLKFLINKAGLGDAFSSLASWGSNLMGGITGAISAGPDAAKAAFGGLRGVVDQISGPLKGLMGAIGPSFENIINLMGGAKAVKKLVRGGVLLDFPINFLINHLMLDQPIYESLVRAAGGALGSLGGGLIVGASTGGLAGFGAAVLGGEAGEALTVGMHNSIMDTDWSNKGNLAVAIKNFLMGTGDNSTGTESIMGDSGSTSANGAAKMSLGGLGVSGNGALGNTGQDIASAQFTAPPQAGANGTKINDYLRKPTTTNQTVKTGGSGTNITTTTLPAQVVSPPVKAQPKPQKNTQDSSPIPAIASSHPGFSFYEMFAQDTFELGVV